MGEKEFAGYKEEVQATIAAEAGKTEGALQVEASEEVETGVAPRACLGLRELSVNDMLLPVATEAVPLTKEEQTALEDAELPALIVREAMQYEDTAWADMQ